MEGLCERQEAVRTPDELAANLAALRRDLRSGTSTEVVGSYAESSKWWKRLQKAVAEVSA